MAASKKVIKKRETNKVEPTILLSKNSILFQTNIALKEVSKRKLFDYYVLRPINLENISRKSIKIRLNTLKSKEKERIKQIFNYLNKEVFVISKDSKTIEKWFANGMFPSVSDNTLERMCILDTYKSSSSPVPSIYFFVRNCLCHGNFEVKNVRNDQWLVLEDNDKTYIKGRGIVKVNTLISFAECFLELANNRAL